jgi:hypothetical protein
MAEASVGTTARAGRFAKAPRRSLVHQAKPKSYTSEHLMVTRPAVFLI